MLVKFKAILIGAICTTSLQAWSLDASGIKSCMNLDSQLINRSKPIDIEIALSNWQLRSEIFYQVDANRSRLVSDYSDYTLLEDHKALINEYDRAESEYDKLIKEYDIQNPSPRPEDYSHEEYEKIYELHLDKRAQYANSIYSPVNKARVALESFQENIGTSPKRPAYIQEIETKIAESKDDLRLKEYRVMKSYGDYMLQMIKRAKSCEDLHSQYVKLAQEAKAKKNFHFETLSSTTIFRIIGLSAEDKQEMAVGISDILAQEGFKNAANTFDFDKHKSILLMGVFGNYANVMSLLYNGKSSSQPVFRTEGEFRSTDMNSEELDALIAKHLRTGLLHRHQKAQELVLSYIK